MRTLYRYPSFPRWLLDGLSAETVLALFRETARTLADRSRRFGVEDAELTYLCIFERSYQEKRGICLFDPNCPL